MLNVLKHLNSRDRHGLAIFFGIALLCFLYFASGILVTYVSSPEGALEVARDGRGYTVRVFGLQTFSAAEKLSTALWDQRRVPADIEADPFNQGYLLRVGPLAKRADAETLTNDLTSSGYGTVNITPTCPPGIADCNPESNERK